MRNKKIALSNHCIICGFGRTGKQIARILAAEQTPFLVIDRRPESLAFAKSHQWPSVEGDAAINEKVLQEAAIESAQTIIITVGEEADTIFIAISAKALNPNITIVAKAATDEAEEKLKKIGVQQVVQPHRLSGAYMADVALHPETAEQWEKLFDGAVARTLLQQANGREEEKSTDSQKPKKV